MIIFGPKNAAYDIDIGAVMLSDWYHEDYFTLVEGVVGNGSSGVPVVTAPLSDNNLINGKMDYTCSTADSTPCTDDAGISKFIFTTGKTHRLRLINTGAEGLQRFSIDGHNVCSCDHFMTIQC